MPIRIPNKLPAKAQLEAEHIFVMPELRATTQDIRPLKIAILNLMPTKIATETQLLRLLSNTPLQIDVELIRLDTHTSKNTSKEHLLAFYQPFSDVKGKRFDGLIITGAPIEHLEFEEVGYWGELCKIMDWSKTNVTSTLHICWGAQAAMYHHYGIGKVLLGQKISGVFPHKVVPNDTLFFRGFDNVFYAPHSRWSSVDVDALKACPAVEVLAVSPTVGIHIARAKQSNQLFAFGHMEYDANTLAQEYVRDIAKDPHTQVPANYFPGDDPQNPPTVTWRAHANLLFSNWLNFVYQETPYDIA
ncbi:MAG: homoserine O-succinyltransferase [Oscillospiraceae bacterium]|nr:homoserine O-succinyltransferase [Oscillospiraceae bacterium]